MKKEKIETPLTIACRNIVRILNGDDSLGMGEEFPHEWNDFLLLPIIDWFESQGCSVAEALEVLAKDKRVNFGFYSQNGAHYPTISLIQGHDWDKRWEQRKAAKNDKK